MKEFKTVFERNEKKYLVSSEEKQLILRLAQNRLSPDGYGKSTVCNIYFDTPDYRLIRNSIEKPVYKEKFRLRCYGVPSDDSTAFVELKKKYKGVVYKRRFATTYRDAVLYTLKGVHPKQANRQVLNEMDYVFSFYGNLHPAVSLFYDREAFFSKEDDSLRITFDTAVRFRNEDFDLSHGDRGEVILAENTHIMEIKCADSMPLWLTEILTENNIYPATFSKYAQAYRTILGKNKTTAVV